MSLEIHEGPPQMIEGAAPGRRAFRSLLQTAFLPETELIGDARSFELQCVYCRRRVSCSFEVYTGREWHSCCRLCYRQRLNSVARTLDELREPGMLAFRMRVPIRKRLSKCRTPDGQSELPLFGEF